MAKYHYLTPILILTVSVPAQALTNPPASHFAEQAPAKTPREPPLSGEAADKAKAKQEDMKKDKQEQQTVKTAEKQQDTFTPTEEISEDLAVSFPVDI
ncbi:hypothetical protein SG34_022010 [Thalassomonas viridans]|uniref:Uncharacterized protein n=1 Tax=Thalassomonas viridans TaxID=137584 RepID=A0AAE9Z2G5_9GAMM|nr:hypothetical protein [Thalassomonas viridans]WDE04013.1 hypothetical protein SG34_022010 [Thalassomonas viridans]